MNEYAAMDPAAVEQAAQRIRKYGEQLGTTWNAAKSAIAGAESGIGTGRLADAFRQTYQPASQTARTNADAIPPKFTDLAADTTVATGTYEDLDTGATSAIEGTALADLLYPRGR